MDSQVTVFVVDDDPAARKSVCALTSSIGIQSESYASAEEFLDAFAGGRPGCLVTDVRMLGMTGVDLQERLNSMGISLPVIVITAFAETPLTVRAMKNGAVTLLEKPCQEFELLGAIREALAKDEETRHANANRDDVRRRLASLTEQERHVMNLMIDGKMNKSIAAELDVSLRTVESRRHNLFEKMGTRSLAELVRMVMLVEPLDPVAS